MLTDLIYSFRKVCSIENNFDTSVILQRQNDQLDHERGHTKRECLLDFTMTKWKYCRARQQEKRCAHRPWTKKRKSRSYKTDDATTRYTLSWHEPHTVYFLCPETHHMQKDVNNMNTVRHPTSNDRFGWTVIILQLRVDEWQRHQKRWIYNYKYCIRSTTIFCFF